MSEIPMPRPGAIVAKAEIERLRTELDKATRLLSQMLGWQRDAEVAKVKLRAQRDELLVALKPFAQKADAISLSKALGHISREHLFAARDAVAKAEKRDE